MCAPYAGCFPASRPLSDTIEGNLIHIDMCGSLPPLTVIGTKEVIDFFVKFWKYVRKKIFRIKIIIDRKMQHWRYVLASTME